VLHGEQPDWFRAVLANLGCPIEGVLPFAGETLPEAGSFTSTIIARSWSMIMDREEWSEQTAGWIRQVFSAGARLFGVCYGHQLMAHALGGRVDYHPKGREIGTETIRLLAGAQDDRLLMAMPAHFPAHLTHMQTVIDLPTGAQVLAGFDHDPHQIVRYSRNAISTQFHPEITPAIIRLRADKLRGEGRDPDALLAAVEEAPEMVDLLRRFIVSGLTERSQPH